jgi:hypothetical protein
MQLKFESIVPRPLHVELTELKMTAYFENACSQLSCPGFPEQKGEAG